MKTIILIFALFLVSTSSSFAWWQVQQRSIYSYDGLEEYDYHDVNANAYCDVFWISGSCRPQPHVLGANSSNDADVAVMDGWSQIWQYTYRSEYGPTETGSSGSWMDQNWGTVRGYTTLTNGTVTYIVEGGTRV